MKLLPYPIQSINSTTAIIRNYEATRNYPALDQTSRTGAHLRFGTLSVRKMAAEASKEEGNHLFKRINLAGIFHANFMAFSAYELTQCFQAAIRTNRMEE